MEGYQALFEKQLVTVWSAPNYCYRCGNMASILELGGEGVEWHFNQFDAVPEDERSYKGGKNASKDARSPEHFM